MACYKVIILLGDSHLCNYLRILHYISKDIFLLSATYSVYSHYLIDIDKDLLLSVLCEMLKVQKQVTMCCTVSILHSILWITARFTHRTKRVEYSPSFSSELTNNRNISVFKDVSTEVGTTEQAANEAKPMAIVRIWLCWVLVPCDTWFLLGTDCKLEGSGEASARKRFIAGNVCHWKRLLTFTAFLDNFCSFWCNSAIEEL